MKYYEVELTLPDNKVVVKADNEEDAIDIVFGNLNDYVSVSDLVCGDVKEVERPADWNWDEDKEEE
jgi:hypothetical protein